MLFLLPLFLFAISLTVHPANTGTLSTLNELDQQQNNIRDAISPHQEIFLKYQEFQERLKEIDKRELEIVQKNKKHLEKYVPTLNFIKEEKKYSLALKLLRAIESDLLFDSSELPIPVLLMPVASISGSLMFSSASKPEIAKLFLGRYVGGISVGLGAYFAFKCAHIFNMKINAQLTEQQLNKELFLNKIKNEREKKQLQREKIYLTHFLKENRTFVSYLEVLKREYENSCKKSLKLRIKALPLELQDSIAQFIYLPKADLYYSKKINDIFNLKSYASTLINSDKNIQKFAKKFKMLKISDGYKVFCNARVFGIKKDSGKKNNELLSLIACAPEKNGKYISVRLYSSNLTELCAQFSTVPLKIVDHTTFCLVDLDYHNKPALLGSVKSGFEGEGVLYKSTCNVSESPGVEYKFQLNEAKTLHQEPAEISVKLLKVGFVSRKSPKREELGPLDYDRIYFIVRRVKKKHELLNPFCPFDIDVIERYEMPKGFSEITDPQTEKIIFNLTTRVDLNDQRFLTNTWLNEIIGYAH